MSRHLECTSRHGVGITKSSYLRLQGESKGGKKICISEEKRGGMGGGRSPAVGK